MKYIGKLDAIRAFAVLMVIMSHWIPKTSKVILFGEIGVDIFFVISGFLITRILLTDRDTAELGGGTKGQALFNFVLRRALRIFPIYYLALFLFWIMQPYEGYSIRENIAYYATYTSNILFFQQNRWDSYLAPLWSLAVEEQFYLVWPFLIMFIPEQHTLKLILISVVTGIVFPYFYSEEMVKVLTPSCMNALGAGALLAWFMVKRPDVLQRYSRALLAAGAVSFVLMLCTFLLHPLSFLRVQARTFIAVVSVVGILYCTGAYKPVAILEWVLNARVLIFIGQISYGLYLYHNLISIVWRNFVLEHMSFIADMIGKGYADLLLLVVKFLVLLGAAWCSYRFIERPFLSLKRYFVMDKTSLA